MNDDDIRKLTGAAAFDQTIAGLGQLAATYGTFYQGLLKEGIPDDLACSMVRDWFNLQVKKMLWPDSAPPWEGE